jgi:dTDP-4-amino-4,6-dideoxygalactose transaminase
MAEAGIAHRQRLIEMYKRRLGQLSGIRFQKTTSGGVSNGVYFSIILDPQQFRMSRDQLYVSLRVENVDTRRYYHPPLHLQKVNRHLAASYRGRLPHTERVAANSLTLPLFSHMSEEQVTGVCDAIERLHRHGEAVSGQAQNLFAEVAE